MGIVGTRVFARIDQADKGQRFILVLTSKFGKPRNCHRPRVSIGFRVLESAEGNYQSPAIGFLMDSVKEINQLNKAYPEDAKFEEDAAWQFIY